MKRFYLSVYEMCQCLFHIKKLIVVSILFSQFLYADSSSYLLQKNIQSAIKEAKATINKNKDTSNYAKYLELYREHLNLGTAYVLLGKFKEAEEEYTKYVSTLDGYNIKTLYRKLLKLYPKKEKDLQNGWQLFSKCLNQESNKWRVAGVDKYNEMNWKFQGYTAKEAAKWVKIGIGNTHVKEYKDNNITLEVAQEWKNTNLSIYEIKKYIKYNISPQDISEWLQAGVKMSYIEYWVRDGITTASEYKKLKNIGIRSYERYKSLKKLGLTQKDIARWTKVIKPHDIGLWIYKGVKTPEEAMRWKSQGITLSNIKYYKKLGIEVKEVEKNPLLKEVVKYFNKNKKEYDNAVQALKINGCKTLNSNFYNADIYDNKGKCYYFRLSLYQRLGRYDGLAIAYNHIVYVKFNQSWSEKSTKSGIIKGMGNYKYNTTYGMKNVSKGKVIYFK